MMIDLCYFLRPSLAIFFNLMSTVQNLTKKFSTTIQKGSSSSIAKRWMNDKQCFAKTKEDLIIFLGSSKTSKD
jgi:hypothetical protein